MRVDQAEVRLDFAKKSYDEVLDATKHQDDKIGRFLTAIAFLFTGAIAFGARSDIVGATVAVDGSGISLAGIFLGLFLGLAILSVLLLLVALGPNLNLPSPERDTPETTGKDRSRIFFLSMARMTPQSWWLEQWQDDEHPTPGEVVRNYVFDAHNLATKTTFKSARTNEARATFTLALLFLALSVALSFDSATRQQDPAEVSAAVTATSPALTPLDEALPWDGRARALVATTVGVFAFVLAYDYLRLAQTPLSYTRRGGAGFWPLYLILFSVPAFCVLCIAPPLSGAWRVVAQYSCLALIALFVAAAIGTLGAGDEDQAGKRGTWIAVFVGLGAAGVILVWTAFDQRRSRELLLASLVAVTILELPRLSLGFRSWLRRKESLRKHPQLAIPTPGGPKSKLEPPSSPAVDTSSTPKEKPAAEDPS